jgi:hypothetical protein
MNTTPKTDECIKMLNEALFCFQIHYDVNSKEDIISELYDKDEVIDYQRRIIAMLDYRLMPIRVITIDENTDKDKIRESISGIVDFDGFWYVLKNYPLITDNDLKNEFWNICPDLKNMSEYLDVMWIKYKDVMKRIEDIPDRFDKNIYKALNKLLDSGIIDMDYADKICYNLYFIAKRYNFKIELIINIYKTFRKMSKQSVKTDIEQPQHYNFTKLLTEQNMQIQDTLRQEEKDIIQFTDEKKNILKSYFISQFKGLGNKTINYFDENLIIDLQKKRTGKEYAAIAKMIHESKNATQSLRQKTFTKWHKEFCDILDVNYTTYKRSQITITDALKREFYYLCT